MNSSIPRYTGPNEYKLDENLYIADIDKVVEFVVTRSGREDLKKADIKKALKAGQRFFVGRLLEKITPSCAANFCLIRLPYSDRVDGLGLFAYLFRYPGCLDMMGFKISTLPYFIKTTILSQKDLTSEDVDVIMTNAESIAGAPVSMEEGALLEYSAVRLQSVPCFSRIAEAMSQRLFVDPFEEGGMEIFLKELSSKITAVYNEKGREDILRNASGDVVVNTGLMDKYGSDIAVFFKMDAVLKAQQFTPIKIMNSKQDYVSEGFSVEKSSALSPLLLSDGEIFDASENSVDISYEALDHLFSDRMGRFPSSLSTLSLDALASQLKASVQMAVKIQQRSGSYIKPYYSAKRGTVSWVAPLYITSAKHGDEPDVVAVFSPLENSCCELKTVLPYSKETRNKIIASNLYGGFW